MYYETKRNITFKKHTFFESSLKLTTLRKNDNIILKDPCFIINTKINIDEIIKNKILLKCTKVHDQLTQ